MSRVTLSDLESAINRLNEISGSPKVSYVRENGKSIAQIGNFHLYQAYGAFALHRMTNSGGGVNDVIGLTTKRELLGKIESMIYGYRLNHE